MCPSRRSVPSPQVKAALFFSSIAGFEGSGHTVFSGGYLSGLLPLSSTLSSLPRRQLFKSPSPPFSPICLLSSCLLIHILSTVSPSISMSASASPIRMASGSMKEKKDKRETSLRQISPENSKTEEMAEVTQETGPQPTKAPNFSVPQLEQLYTDWSESRRFSRTNGRSASAQTRSRVRPTRRRRKRVWKFRQSVQDDTQIRHWRPAVRQAPGPLHRLEAEVGKFAEEAKEAPARSGRH